MGDKMQVKSYETQCDEIGRYKNPNREREF